MPSPRENILEVDKLIESEATAFLSGVEKSQTGIFARIHALSKKLELDSTGNIKPNSKNLRVLNELRQILEGEVLNKAYKARVDKLTRSFPKIQNTNDKYFFEISKAFNPDKLVFRRQLTQAVDLTRNSLLETGINQNVINPIVNIVDSSITTGASWSDMVDELRLVIKGDAERLGGLERYASQITTDALNQYNANYNQTVSKELDLDWFFYAGGLRKTSRPFCKGHAGKYYHRKEVEDFGKGKDVDGSRLTKAELQGRIPGTNSSSIFTNRGGYNCRHIYKGTLIANVPKSVIGRNVKKGYFDVGEDE